MVTVDAFQIGSGISQVIRNRHDVQNIHNASSEGLKESPEPFEGFRVFVKTERTPPAKTFVLYPQAKHPQFMLHAANPGLMEISELPPQQVFTVVSNVDDRVYIEYFVTRSNLSQLAEINASLVMQIRSAMVDIRKR
jgi:hypothetical protein